MAASKATPSRKQRYDQLPLPPRALIGFAIAIAAVVIITLLSYKSLLDRAAIAQRISRSLDVMERLQLYLSTVKDAETGQRGYLLTNSESYLEPYTNATAVLPALMKVLRTLTEGNRVQSQRLETVDQLTQQKLEELNESLKLARTGNMRGALALVRSDRGQVTMDTLRATIARMLQDERSTLTDSQQEWASAAATSNLFVVGGCGLLLFLIAAGALMSSRDYRARQTERWTRVGQVALGERIQGEQRLEVLGERVLQFLAGYLDAHIGALYIREGPGFQRFATYAIARRGSGAELRIGEGLVGEAVKSKQLLRVSDVPTGYMTVTSSVGQADPRELVICPASVDGDVNCVIELGFLRSVSSSETEFLRLVSDRLAVAVRASRDRSRLEELLGETQRQSEELQTQQEELRVSNEELEEQGRALKKSQAQMETQQAELEQTNAQLEEHTQLLGAQKDDLAHAQRVLEEKAGALERSNQYKSEFLANMSHELRTPLNSSLILSKLLADNKNGNLTDEEVKYARMITSSGNDLLALINDILDLSKIEAGKITIEPIVVSVSGVIDELIKSFELGVKEKGLELTARVEEGAPGEIETDPQRLSQILKNLISNALKFTDKGSVSLRYYAAVDSTVSFAVSDTGIGIPAAQQGLIFEAFMQADGSTSRKHGGTGLGLSISRDLAKLLGGNIALQSVPNQGSTFTLNIPVAYVPFRGESAVSPRLDSQYGRDGRAKSPTVRPKPVPAIDDDRDHLAIDRRLILVIEDDPHFATILRDLAHELEFQCVVAQTAKEGLLATESYAVSAILLDINLPDQSGLGVLDKLKHGPKTRHIPVHMLSVMDYSREARELGAVGYALKPVKREQLVGAFQLLQEKFSQHTRRVLVVEDDPRQRESIRHLLASSGVQITDAENGAAALVQLRANTFDCMVMDLNLPDLSGYELLEKMAKEDAVPFPPVIVYTGHSLTPDEEQRLRRYSRSIIIKDARSPERLLDEVTLFLHQVEAELPQEQQRMLKVARDRDESLEGRCVLVVEDDVRNVFALSSVLEPKGAKVEIARNGLEAIAALERSTVKGAPGIDLVLMDIMMPEMDGLTAMREIRKRPAWKRLPIIALTAKAMKDDQEMCLEAGANDYIAKPLDVDKLLTLIRVWMRR